MEVFFRLSCLPLIIHKQPTRPFVAYDIIKPEKSDRIWWRLHQGRQIAE